MTEAIVRNYSPKTHKKCIKCRAWKARKAILDPVTGEVLEKKGFGDHNSSDGLQSICHSCKNKRTTELRSKNTKAQLRHHISTRCLTQLGKLAPDKFTVGLEGYLGYRITALVKHLRKDLKEREGKDRKLRDALQEGYHIDHIMPLSSYDVVVRDPQDGYRSQYPTIQVDDEWRMVDWVAFRDCWRIENLSAIPAAENLTKGAKIHDPRQDEILDEGDPEVDLGDVAEFGAPEEDDTTG